jgi:adenosylmethionine-8-amino-7-oxononanoate aminotransferase
MAQQRPPILSEADALQQAVLKNMWMPTQRWSKIAEDGVLVITEGRGTKIKDIDGVWRYDGSAGLMLVNIGHVRQEVVDAISGQLSRLHYANTFTYGTPDVIRFAEKIASLTPGDLNRVLFVSGGSEAVESALKIAYQYHANRGDPGRTKFIARQGSYHGVSRGALSVGTATVLARETWEPVLPDTVRFAPQPLLYHDDESTTQEENDIRCAQAIEQIIIDEGPETVAAVIGEPISHSAGVVVPGGRYWPMLRDICDRHGVLLIADEVITGFGRPGKWFAMEHWNVVPDMMTFAKGMTSGYWPVGACVVTDSVFAAFQGGPETTYAHGFTYGGHPAGGAAGLANVGIIEREDLPGNAARMGAFPPQVIGKACDGWEGERWLDIRANDALVPVMFTRLDHCRDKGFDGIEPDNIDGYTNDTGFPLTYDDQLAFNRWLANAAHERGLSIGLKNDDEQVDDLIAHFDWALTEDCFDQGWCDEMTPFIDAGKAVFAAEYTDTGITTADFCADATSLRFSAILKDRELTRPLESC